MRPKSAGIASVGVVLIAAIAASSNGMASASTRRPVNVHLRSAHDALVKPTSAQDQARLVAAVKHFAVRGLHVSRADLRVYRVHTAAGTETVVAPSSQKYALRSTGTDPAGVPTYDLSPIAAARPFTSRLFAGGRTSVTAVSWVKNASDCGDVDITRAVRTVCWEWDQETGDSSSTYNYWQFKMNATGRGANGYRVSSMWVEAYHHSGTPTQTMDYPGPKPATATNHNCTTVNLSISGGVPVAVGLSFPLTWCETWTPKSYSDTASQAHYSNKWNGGTANQREIGMNLPIKVAQGSYPTDSLLSGQVTYH